MEEGGGGAVSFRAPPPVPHSSVFVPDERPHEIRTETTRRGTTAGTAGRYGMEEKGGGGEVARQKVEKLRKEECVPNRQDGRICRFAARPARVGERERR